MSLERLSPPRKETSLFRQESAPFPERSMSAPLPKRPISMRRSVELMPIRREQKLQSPADYSLLDLYNDIIVMGHDDNFLENSFLERLQVVYSERYDKYLSLVPASKETSDDPVTHTVSLKPKRMDALYTDFLKIEAEYQGDVIEDIIKKIAIIQEYFQTYRIIIHDRTNTYEIHVHGKVHPDIINKLNALEVVVPCEAPTKTILTFLKPGYTAEDGLVHSIPLYFYLDYDSKYHVRELIIRATLFD